jgi:hypothetical protein
MAVNCEQEIARLEGLLRKQDDEYMEMATLVDRKIQDTFLCWYRTRIAGNSASMVCEGNIDTDLLAAFDKLSGRTTGESK